MEGVFYTTEVELRCSGQNLRKLPQSTDLGSDTGQIKYMDLSYNKISTLDGIESYSSLETLILDCNRIGDDVEFPCCQSLTTISLNKNQIADLDHLILNLKRMAPKLRFLSLLGNCACPHQLMGLNYDDSDYHRYRCYVIYCLPTLKFLDSTPVTRGEREEAALRGKYFQVVKPITLKTQTKSMRQDRKDLIPLPPAKLNLALHKDLNDNTRLPRILTHPLAIAAQLLRFPFYTTTQKSLSKCPTLYVLSDVRQTRQQY